MTDNANTVDDARRSMLSPRMRTFVRRVLYPAAVIAAIIAVIWWLDHRGGDSAPGGGEYGVRDFAAGLVPPGAKIEAEEGAYAPNFELEVLGGGDATLADYRGHPVVLNFWATWCMPCRQEVPQLVAAQERYADDGLVIIGLDLQEGPGLIQPFVDDYGIEYPVLIDRDSDVGDKYRLLGLPTTFFIDAEGVIQSIYRGPLQQGADSGYVPIAGAIGQSELDQRIAQIMGTAPETE